MGCIVICISWRVILKKECSALLSDFFKERRQAKKELKKANTGL